MKRLILHIGSPKAGSTSLQRFLAENRPALARAGIDVPVLDPRDGPRHLSLRDALADDDDDAPVFAAVAKAIAATGGDTIVLTSEGIAGIDDIHRVPARLARMAELWGAEIDVVAFVRPQHLFLNSSYAQHVKNLTTGERFGPFVDRMVHDRRFDYGRVFGTWSAIFGRRFHAVPFTAAEIAEGLERRFARTVGLDARLDAIPGLKPAPHVNQSPGPLTVEVLRRVAEEGGRRRIGSKVRLARRHLAQAATGPGWTTPRFSALTPAIVERVRSEFHERNESFAERHWARSWDSVFAPDYQRDFASNEYDAASAPSETEAEIAARARELLKRFGEPETLLHRFGRMLRRLAP